VNRAGVGKGEGGLEEEEGVVNRCKGAMSKEKKRRGKEPGGIGGKFWRGGEDWPAGARRDWGGGGGKGSEVSSFFRIWGLRSAGGRDG